MLSNLLGAHFRQIVALEDQAIHDLMVTYRATQLDLVQQLAGMDAAGKGETLTAQHLALMLAQVDGALRVMTDAGGQRLGAAFREALTTGARQQHAEILDLERRFGTETLAKRVQGVVPVVPVQVVNNLAQPTSLLLSRFADGVHAEVARSLGVSVAAGESVAKAAKRLGDAMEGERYQLERIARTEINHAANAGHFYTLDQVQQELPELEIQKQWSAHLDRRTSARCRGLHLQVREVRAEFVARDGWRGLYPPAHPNCRSRVLPYSPRWEASAAKKQADQGPGAAANPEAASRPTAGQQAQAERSNEARGITPAPSHLIREADVPAFLEGSAVPQVVYHRTTNEAAEAIRRDGVDVARGAGNMFGEGLYTAIAPVHEYGPAEVRVAVRTTNPLEVPDLARGQLAVRMAATRQNPKARTPREVRQALLDAGYDAIIVRRRQGPDFVVAIKPENVRILE